MSRSPIPSSVRLLLVLALAGAVAACGGGGRAGEPGAGEPGADPLLGDWRVDTGSLYRTYEAFARIEPDGSFSLFSIYPWLDLLVHTPGTFDRPDAAALALDLWDEDPELLDVAFLDADRVALTRPTGERAVLARIPAIPDDAMPRPAAVSRRWHFDVEPGRGGGLAYDGSQLWFSDDDYGREHAHPVDPASGALGTSTEIGAKLHAASGTEAFWAHCGCGPIETAQLLNRFGEVQDWVTPRELGVDFALISSIALDDDGQVLYLFGMNHGRGMSGLAVVEIGTFPRVVSQQIDLPLQPEGMAYADGLLWMVRRDGHVHVLDTATWRRLRTFDGLDRSVRWRGIALRSTLLATTPYVLGEDADGHSVIVQLAPILKTSIARW